MLQKNNLIYFACLGIIVLILQSLTIKPISIPESSRSKTAIDNNINGLKSAFNKQELSWGNNIFIRIFKQSKTLEIWVKKQQQFVLFKSYPICYFSGTIGPKKKAGDNQAPEGIYSITANQMNPYSNYHLSFNVGYPNRFDRFYNYTGNSIMVHGNCVSIGCFAMTDAVIEEIWTLMHASFAGGQQKIMVHIFPFANMASTIKEYAYNSNYGFWKQLSAVDSAFNATHRVPEVKISKGKYLLN